MIKKYFYKIKKYWIKYIILSFIIFFIPLTFISAQSNGSSCRAADGIFLELISGTSGGIFESGLLGQSTPICDLVTNTSPAMPADVQNAIVQSGGKPTSYVQGGGVMLLAQIAQYSQSSAASTSNDAITYVAEKFSPTVSAQTQSSALQGLSPILVIWGIGRNITYIVLAISLVITGLVLYFGAKGGKQNNATAGVMISEIVVTLIFITISYPIGAIVVDLVVNLGNALIANLLNPFINSNSILANLYTPSSNTNILNLVGDLQRVGVSSSTVNLIKSGLNYIQTPLSNANQFISGIVKTPGNDLGTQLSNIPASLLIGTLATIVFAVAQGVANQGINQYLIVAIISFTIFILVFRITFSLLGSFVGIILTIGFSPLLLIGGAFPGINAFTNFANWLKRLISLAIVFPITFGLLLLSAIFLNLKQSDTSSVNTGAPCVYQNTNGSVPVLGTDKGVSSYFYDVKRFPDTTSVPIPTTTPQVPLTQSDDTNAQIRKCFPVLLPPKFSWFPAPIGSFGSGFDIDDFTRYVVGLAFLIIIPNISKVVQEALKIKSPPLASLSDALAGAGLLSTFVGQIPVIGKPIAQIVGGISGIAK